MEPVQFQLILFGRTNLAIDVQVETFVQYQCHVRVSRTTQLPILMSHPDSCFANNEHVSTKIKFLNKRFGGEKTGAV